MSQRVLQINYTQRREIHINSNFADKFVLSDAVNEIYRFHY